MKKLLFISCIAMVAAGCSNSGTKDPVTTADKKPTDSIPVKMEYPYSLDKPYQNWQPGNQQHAVTVMKGLKAFEAGDIPSCAAMFGDSADLFFDNYRAKLSNDSLKKMFTGMRNNYSNITVKMYDWESVISSDKKEEWVTLWYKQTWTDKKGKTDSMSYVDDAKIVNGKVVLLDEKQQRYPAAKK